MNASERDELLKLQAEIAKAKGQRASYGTHVSNEKLTAWVRRLEEIIRGDFE